MIGVLRDNPNLLIDDPKKDLRTFRITSTSPLGPKRGTGRGGFIDSVLAAVDGFYGAVVQQLRPWAAKAPQLPRGGRTAAEEAGLELEPPPQDLLEEPAEGDVASVGGRDDDLDVQVTVDVSSHSPDEVTEPAPQVDGDRLNQNRAEGTSWSEAGHGDEKLSQTNEDEPPAAWLASAGPTGDGELDAQVVWDDAQQRLERERAGNAGGQASAS